MITLAEKSGVVCYVCAGRCVHHQRNEICSTDYTSSMGPRFFGVLRGAQRYAIYFGKK